MPRASHEGEIKRLNLELNKAVFDRIAEVGRLTGATSTSEVLRRALTVYEALVRAQRAGERLIMTNGSREREFLVLE
jgi:hypothetical protein